MKPKNQYSFALVLLVAFFSVSSLGEQITLIKNADTGARGPLVSRSVECQITANLVRQTTRLIEISFTKDQTVSIPANVLLQWHRASVNGQPQPLAENRPIPAGGGAKHWVSILRVTDQPEERVFLKLEEGREVRTNTSNVSGLLIRMLDLLCDLTNS